MRYVCGWNWADRMAGVVYCKGTEIRGAKNRPAGSSDWLLLICAGGPQGALRGTSWRRSLVTARALAGPAARAMRGASGKCWRRGHGSETF
jgi:hypothetical protein